MKVITLSQDSFEKDCVRLYEMVVCEFQPDTIISIASGGDYIVEVIKKVSNANFFSVSKRRTTSTKKSTRIASLIFKLLRFIPYFFLNVMRNIEHSILMRKSVNTLLDEVVSIDIDKRYIENKKILVIDDAIDSGKTALVVKRSVLLSGSEPENVKLAVIVQTKSDPFIMPDFVLYRQCLIRFPWSHDFKK